jgi:hypothetical protein
MDFDKNHMFFRFNWRRVLLLSPLVILLLFAAATVHVDLSGDMEGVYLLKDATGLSFELQNDLYLGDEQKLLLRLDFSTVRELLSRMCRHDTKLPLLRYEWSERNGRGLVFNYLPDGKRLLTCLGRFRDSDGLVPKGLFVGGGLPVSRHEDMVVTMNETGMAFYDGKEWKHLWCSVNEAVASGTNPEKMLTPSHWRYVDSHIVEAGDKRLILRSRHELELDGVPLAIRRVALFRAGEKYFVLAVSIRNVGSRAVSYHYVYGDEPWVGEFGTSVGNVGWVKDKIYYYEGQVDPYKYDFAGMYDFGNKMIFGGKQTFSGVANFIEWLGGNRPDLVYFSNKIGEFAQEADKMPLYSKDNRVIFLQWGPRPIMPNESHLYLLAIGMADHVAGQELPVKPSVTLTADDYRLLAGRD